MQEPQELVLLPVAREIESSGNRLWRRPAGGAAPPTALMAWRRGTQNQQAGEIRKGHIKEFLVPSSAKLAGEDESGALEVVATESLLPGESLEVACAYVSRDLAALPAALRAAMRSDGCVHVHYHEHPAVVQRCVPRDGVPSGAIALSEVQRLNNRVCVHDAPTFTLYRGRHETLDAREAAIGATDVTKAVPDVDLAAVAFEVRKRYEDGAGAAVAVDFSAVSRALGAHVFGCILTTSELVVLPKVKAADGATELELVARVVLVRGDADEGDDEDDDADDDDDDEYRGRMVPTTTVYAVADDSAPVGASVALVGATPVPRKGDRAEYVDVVCADEEVFPVRRALLRPCLALTRLAQAGRGKYKDDEAAEDVAVPLDCCTFDRVLLYLQHEKRGKPFKFDPTLAQELLEAAVALKIRGLEDATRKVLGSFDERVRKAPIRLAEVNQRNAKGGQADPRTETWLVLDGMVLDISRWLSEHPGGNTIIPDQALGCDCAVMFEIYHVSRQSFAYLREFYVGELHRDDRPNVPLPKTLPPGAQNTGGAASQAFLAELRRHTSWRLKDADLVYPAWKSF